MPFFTRQTSDSALYELLHFSANSLNCLDLDMSYISEAISS